jgi:Secretion system C-terminal sorting domain
MKYIYIIALLLTVSVSTNAQYFEASVKRTGSSLEFYLRPKVGGTDITNFKFDNIDMFIRWPDNEADPIFGTPVPNTTNFPGLTISKSTTFNPYDGEVGFKNIEFFSPPSNSTSTPQTYVAGTQYLVFSVPITGPISNNIQFAADNDNATIYYLTLTRNTAGIGGPSDHSSHNTALGGNVLNQLFYGLPAQLSSNGASFYQKIGAGVVPVKFTSFSATKKDNDALLSWLVENETSLVTTYEIERSIDGIKFDKINTIAKNGGISNIYNITDANLSALKNRGIIYYRIKQMDVNGEFVYSDIKSVRMNDKGTLISIFPNPVVDITTVKIDVLEATDGTISLINADGKQLQTSTLKAAKGLNLKKIDMNNLPKGDYLLKVMLGTELQTIKVVKL